VQTGRVRTKSLVFAVGGDFVKAFLKVPCFNLPL